jgi:hypothetical protein
VITELQPRPSERFVLSYLAHADELHYAALVLGPARMSSLSWPDWQRHHDLVVHLDHGGVPAAFSVAHEGWTAARTSLTQRVAQDWLSGILAGQAAAVGGAPGCSATVGDLQPLLLARQHNRSRGSQLVEMAARPVGGVFAPISAEPLPAPLEWPIGTRPHWLLTVLGVDTRAEPVPSGRFISFPDPTLVVARLSRRAWIGRVRFRPEEGLQVEIRREPAAYPDFHGLVVELTEGDAGELFDARRLALSDVRLPSRAKTRLWLRLPTLGRGIERSLRLYDRAGELLDFRDPFNFVESVDISLNVEGSPTTSNVVVGDRRGRPQLPERLQALRDAEAAWERWRSTGLRYRVVRDRRAMRAHLRRRLRRARSEILVIDPYFGKDPDDWSMVDDLGAGVRVLTGSASARPPGAAPAVAARKWSTSPPPYHDRIWILDGRSGVSAGASVNGLQGQRAYRVAERPPGSRGMECGLRDLVAVRERPGCVDPSAAPAAALPRPSRCWKAVPAVGAGHERRQRHLGFVQSLAAVLPLLVRTAAA